MKKLFLGLVLFSLATIVGCKETDSKILYGTDEDTVIVEQDSIVTDTLVVDSIKTIN